VTQTRIKVDLHVHTSDDPEDAIGHSATDLIDRAAALRYSALAITLHNRYSDCRGLNDYARDRGIVLIPAVERSVDGAHALLINFPPESAEIESFESLRRFKVGHPRGLVVAPHPWFPLGNSLGAARMEQYADLWDAVEVNAFYTRLVDFNGPARRWAAARRLPLVGNGDIHQLRQLGSTYSLVDTRGDVTPDGICSAIKAGRVEVRSHPITHRLAASIAVRAILAGLTKRAW